MDHSWDGAYTGQKREQRFPTILDTNRNYTIEYTGTPPNNQRFTLYGDPGTYGTLITIKYPDAGAFKIYNKDKTLAIPTDWDYEREEWGKPSGRYCGENRFQGVINRLQFWITPGCTLYVRPRDAIMLAIRMEWTVKEFFQEKAVAKFQDRMAAALGIHKADLKVVQVYEGSVIIEFQIMADEDSVDSQKELLAVAAKYEEVIPNIGDSLGAPVMSIMTQSGSVQAMPGYENKQDWNGREGKGFENLIDEFLKEREEAEDANELARIKAEQLARLQKEQQERIRKQ